MRILLLLLSFIPIYSQGAIQNTNSQKNIFTATVVASSCHIRIDADGFDNNLLTFGTFHKSSGTLVAPRTFTVNLLETGATLPGCSAFLTGHIASMKFGNPGQLDSAGVVTRGAGDGVRIYVQAIDTQADYRGRLTDKHDSINYPTDFAAKGLFRFRAKPVMPDTVLPGSYSGALAFVVTWQ